MASYTYHLPSPIIVKLKLLLLILDIKPPNYSGVQPPERPIDGKLKQKDHEIIKSRISQESQDLFQVDAGNVPDNLSDNSPICKDVCNVEMGEMNLITDNTNHDNPGDEITADVVPCQDNDVTPTASTKYSCYL